MQELNDLGKCGARTHGQRAGIEGRGQVIASEAKCRECQLLRLGAHGAQWVQRCAKMTKAAIRVNERLHLRLCGMTGARGISASTVACARSGFRWSVQAKLETQEELVPRIANRTGITQPRGVHLLDVFRGPRVDRATSGSEGRVGGLAVSRTV